MAFLTNPKERNQCMGRRRRRWMVRRRKERGRLIYEVLERLYGEEQARSMWSAYLALKSPDGRSVSTP